MLLRNCKRKSKEARRGGIIASSYNRYVSICSIIRIGRFYLEEVQKAKRKNQMTPRKLSNFASEVRTDIMKMIKKDIDKAKGKF